ncbi:MOSC domain-containing protein [Thiomicrorhabdus sp. ZW0627]|uniref:MOSC domain-containing protein n=1 Tax=Thiomicrorhabdus sp. ZW0627 TaxID=3039774 RepID=UPI0024371333|nr:MOSC domain-containing protein [Thiomicrorhabdus sp. ZW0627]MDG6773017.1 MOSC domain-containing protein [Thiomicrorhabdus sp. ZW0627]
MAKLIGIATHSSSKGPITTHERIHVSKESGLENDYQGARRRETQVTLLSKKRWDEVCRQLDADINWTERRANLLVDDMDFDESMIGQQIQVGSVLLEITCETDPCMRMEAIKPGLKEALTPNWYGGARCKVLREGEIELDDNVSLLKRF